MPGENVQAVIDALEARCPGVKARLYQGDRLRPGIAVVVDGAITRRGLRQALAETSEVQFLPALSGGTEPHPRPFPIFPKRKMGKGVWRIHHDFWP